MRQGVPWDRLVRMSRNELLMLVWSTMPKEKKTKGSGPRMATEADIDRLLG